MHMLSSLTWRMPATLSLGFDLSEIIYLHSPFHGSYEFLKYISSVQFSSVAQSCPTLFDPMNRSTPGLPVHHQLLESTQTHVHQVGDTIQPSSWWYHPTISSSVVPFSSCPQSFPASGSFQMSQLFASSGQSTGVSASTLVLPMNTYFHQNFEIQLFSKVPFLCYSLLNTKISYTFPINNFLILLCYRVG